MDNYILPFDITNIMLDRISSIMKKIGKLNNYLNPALENGLIKMTNPDKPTSKNQMYYKF